MRVLRSAGAKNSFDVILDHVTGSDVFVIAITLLEFSSETTA
jgi:hypothetical protein